MIVVLKGNGKGKFPSIYIKCPICGEWGRLLSYSNRFRVVHDSANCWFGCCTEGYDEIYEAYRWVRRNIPELTRGEIWKVVIEDECDCSRSWERKSDKYICEVS